MVGIPYKWGGDDFIDGFDCSGGAQEILAAFGVDPKGDQTAAALLAHFKKELFGYEKSPEMGCLCFYGTKRTTVHVGIAIDSQTMFEFAGGNSSTTTRQKAANMNAYGRLRPILSRPDFKISIMPKQLEIYLKGGGGK